MTAKMQVLSPRASHTTLLIELLSVAHHAPVPNGACGQACRVNILVVARSSLERMENNENSTKTLTIWQKPWKETALSLSLRVPTGVTSTALAPLALPTAYVPEASSPSAFQHVCGYAPLPATCVPIWNSPPPPSSTTRKNARPHPALARTPSVRLRYLHPAKRLPNADSQSTCQCNSFKFKPNHTFQSEHSSATTGLWEFWNSGLDPETKKLHPKDCALLTCWKLHTTWV